MKYNKTGYSMIVLRNNYDRNRTLLEFDIHNQPYGIVFMPNKIIENDPDWNAVEFVVNCFS